MVRSSVGVSVGDRISFSPNIQSTKNRLDNRKLILPDLTSIEKSGENTDFICFFCE
ncbi:hypothetical protein NIES2104_42230 [Leptolyngbya sp. NIES-2104]|nr:hypothetical protein NIES2104_42230 [Leptolyngbya sp. NIES-2104]